jgi:hypothetical protein
MSTRISLRTGGTIVVAESVDDVKRLLEDGKPHIFTPQHHRTARGAYITPEPIALRIDHVGMLADATGDGSGFVQLESSQRRPTFTDLFEDDDDYLNREREPYGPRP